MTKEIFLREVLEALVSRRFLFLAILCFTLIPLSLFINHRTLDQTAAQQSQASTEYERALSGTVPSDEVEVRVFRYPSRLAILATGLETVQPNTVGITQGGMRFGRSEVQDNPTAALFGTIDLLFVVQLILSLVAIILTFDLICGEKQAGTLKLMLSNPVPRDSILLGKLAAALLTLLVPFLAAVLITLLFLELSGAAILGDGEAWMRIGGFLAFAILYLAAFVNMGAFVSTLTSRPLVSLTILLVLWTGALAVLPQSANLLADLVYPVESSDSFLLRKQLAEQDVERRRLAELERFQGREDYDDLRKPVAEKYAQELQDTHARMAQEHENRRQVQSRIATAISALSPAANLAQAATVLSDTGILQARHFDQRLDEFRSQVHQELFADSYRDLFLGVGGQARLKLIDLEDLPRFQYTPPPASEAFAAVVPQALILGLFNVVFFVGAYLRFRRYDVR